MPRLLVTGASGLLGSNLLLEAPPSWQTIGLFHSPDPRTAQDRQVIADLTDENQTRAALDQSTPDVLIHCAAATNVDACEQNPEATRRLNVDATRYVADWAARHHARFIYISTDSVFDGTRGNYSEADPTHPLNVYARTKWEGEREALERCPGALVLRTNIFGWNRQNKLSLGEFFLRGLMRRDALQGFTDVRFTPLLVNPLAGLIFELLAKNASGILHLGSRDACSKYEFGQRVASAFGLPADRLAPASSEGFAFKAPRAKDTSLNTQQVSRLLGHSLPSVDEGLGQFKFLFASGFVEKLKGQPVEWVAASPAS